MHTRWSIAIFLFWGVISAGLLLLPAMAGRSAEKGWRICRFSLLAAAVGAVAAVAAVALSLNSPANLINVLGKPWAGLSSAIIAQIVIVVVALIGFFKGSAAQRGLVYASAAVAVYAVFCLFRMYMISTRPALNSILLLVTFLFLTLDFALLVRNASSSLSQQGWLYPGASVATGICLLLFAGRLLVLPNPDRIFTFAQLTTGIYAPFFWVSVVLVFLVPALYAAYSYKKRMPLLGKAVIGLYLIGLFAFCGLVNQMPAIVSTRLMQ